MTKPSRSLFARGAVLTLSGALLSGCYTTTNVVTMTPLKTKYPVSASGQYLDANGAIVTEDNYQVLKEFDFQKQVESPRHETTETRLKLEADLDRILAEQHGDALTDVKIVATQYDPGSHGSAAGWKIMGWSFGVTGATLMVAGASIDDGGPLIGVGGVVLGVGVLSYALSALANDPAVWTFQVKGNVVKQTGAATAPEEKPAAEGETTGGLGLSGIPASAGH
ncbi:MAG TPA: hypothetical protein VHM70_24070 [Polyangiaceae bacterium]|jgi:hypothetical protein|nr:hypothetical protein [Polyangiaceae bacterium]